MRKMFILAVALLLVPLISIVVSAQQEASMQSAKLFLNPFYRASMTNNINNTYALSINPPDKLSSVQSAIINFDVYLTPTVTFSLWVNNLPCNNPTYLVSTTFASAGQSRVTFDCSNVITQAGTYTLILKPVGANTGAVNGWADLTYTNNPTGTMTMHGTEYSAGQSAKLWLQLLNSSGSYITTGICYVDIYTPLGGYLIEGATMTNMNHDGIYYYDLSAPQMPGVYPAISKCYYDAGQDRRVSNISLIYTGSNSAGIVTDTNTLNTVYYAIDTAKVPVVTPINRLNVSYNFTDFNSQCGSVSELLLTGITIYWNGIWNTGTANHDVYLYIFNYTGNKWQQLPNKIVGGLGGATQIISNSFSGVNITKMFGINATNPMRIRTEDAAVSEGVKKLSTDYLYASCDQLANPQWQEVKGSSEMHVTSDLDYSISILSYNITTKNLATTLWNGTVINEIYYTGIFENNFQVSAGASMTKLYTIEYQGLHSLPANAYLAFYKVNATGHYPYNFTTQAQTTEGHQSLNFQITLAPLEVAEFEVHARNVWESEFRSINSGVLTVYPLLSSVCDLWAIQTNETPYPYIVPRNQTNVEHTPFYRACANWYDNYYWFNQTYYDGINDKNDLASYDGSDVEVARNLFLQIESDYFNNNFAGNKLKDLTYLLLQDLATTGIYSTLVMADPLNRSDMFGNRFFANVSDGRIANQYLQYIIATSSSINYSRISNLTAQQVWEFNQRNLTYYQNFGDETNYTLIGHIANNSINNINNSAIAESVWGWTGNISVTLGNNIASAIYNYAGDVTAFMDNVANAVWNYVSRYTHGTVLS